MLKKLIDVIKLGIFYFILIIGSLLTFTILLFLFQQMFAKIYYFHKPKPFSGKYLHNPYKDLDSNWYKANFHAHSYAYQGLTKGKQTPHQLIQQYNLLGYDIIGISNYQIIYDKVKNIQKLYIPCYEHGYNILKSHRICIGSSKVLNFDFLFHLFKSNKQQLIEELKKENDLVTIAHPKFINGHTEEDLRYLTGYDCLEVLNHFRDSYAHWDSALSAGIPALIIANDDCHDSDSPQETGVRWTMINSNKLKRNSIVKSLKNGKAYGVIGSYAHNSNFLKEVITKGDTISFKFKSKADSIILIGQSGKIKHHSLLTSEIKYIFKKNDTYIRCIAYTDSTEIYLNPIMRYEINPPVNNLKAEVNIYYTYLWRIITLGAFIIILYLYYKNFKFLLFTYKKRL